MTFKEKSFQLFSISLIDSRPNLSHNSFPVRLISFRLCMEYARQYSSSNSQCNYIESMRAIVPKFAHRIRLETISVYFFSISSDCKLISSCQICNSTLDLDEIVSALILMRECEIYLSYIYQMDECRFDFIGFMRKHLAFPRRMHEICFRFRVHKPFAPSYPSQPNYNAFATCIRKLL